MQSEDNQYPYITVKETTVPANPVAGDQRVYVDPADHKLKRVNSSGTVVTIETAGGSGATIATSAFASPPGSPASGDAWLPNDSLILARYSGAAQIPWGPIFPLTAPISGDFAWINQGGAAIDTANHGILLTSDTTTANNRLRVKSAPGGAYTITALFYPDAGRNSTSQCGIGWRQSSDGKLVNVAVLGNGTLEISKWNSATSFSALYTALSNFASIWPISMRIPIWLRIADDTGNRVISFSGNGIDWRVLHTVGRTDFMTADQVHFFVDAEEAIASRMRLISWAQA